MGLVISENGGNRLPLIDEGTYTAVCYAVIDMGMQKNEKYGSFAKNVAIIWELLDCMVEIDGKEEPRIFTQVYTASLNEKATLRQHLAAWRGRDFTGEELVAFDLRNIIGTACLIQIIHSEKNGTTYANLASIMALPKSTPKPVMTMEPILFDLDTSPLSEIDKLPKWIANKIRASETYKAREKELDFIELEDDGELPF